MKKFSNTLLEGVCIRLTLSYEGYDVLMSRCHNKDMSELR